MKCRLICFTVFSCMVLQLRSQDLDVTTVSKINIMNPGASYETRAGKFQTLYGGLFLNTSTYVEQYNGDDPEYTFYFDPAATLQYRYYYNGYKRWEAGKRTDMNSMNYISFISEFLLSKMPLSEDYIEEEDRRPLARLGVAWGIQRNYNSRFSLDLNLGIGYLVAKGTSLNWNGLPREHNVNIPSFIGQLTLGFWLNKTREE